MKQTEQDVPNPSEKIFLTWLFYFPLVPYIHASVNLVSIEVRVMVSRLFGVKPLPEPVLTYNQLDPWEQTSAKL